MPRATRPHAARGLTVIELLLGIAVIGILVALVAPSMRDLIVMQRLKSINAEFVTDMQYARSESVARNRDIRVRFMNDAGAGITCYVLYLSGVTGDCNCVTGAPGAACSGDFEEVRTTRILADTDVKLTSNPQSLIFRSNGMPNAVGDTVVVTERVSAARGRLRTTINQLGRVSACTPDTSVTGVPTC